MELAKPVASRGLGELILKHYKQECCDPESHGSFQSLVNKLQQGAGSFEAFRQKLQAELPGKPDICFQFQEACIDYFGPVSYTHLTLPTILLV